MKFKHLQIIIFSISFALIGGTLGYRIGRSGFKVELAVKPSPITIVNQNPASQTVDFSLFWQAWNLLNKDYYQKPLDSKTLLYGAITGLYQATTDPYTTFLSPEENKLMNSSLDGQYEGIGVELGMKDGQLIVISPLDGSPALTSGVKAGDKILEIDGQGTVGITLTNAVGKIRGTAGSTVALKLQRDDQTPLELKIPRNKITVKSIKWEQKNPTTAYVRISRFGESTTAEWDDTVKIISFQMPGLTSIILDVRGNPGGYVEAATHIAEDFIKSGMLLIEEDGVGNRQSVQVTAGHKGEFIGKKVIVILDGGSASASEILAGALIDRSNATTVGEKSFGKGVVQNVANLEGGAAVHITVAKWLTPNGTWVQETGITPKYVVKAADESQIKAGVDPQLDKALELAE